MSFAVLDHVATLKGVTPSERAVLVVLAQHERDGTCFPSVGRIADIVGRSVRQVQRVLRRLEALVLDGRAGPVIERSKRTDRRGRQRSNRYAVLPHESVAPIVAKAARKPADARRAAARPDGVSRMSPLEPVREFIPPLTPPAWLKTVPVPLLSAFSKGAGGKRSLSEWLLRDHPALAASIGLQGRGRRRRFAPQDAEN